MQWKVGISRGENRHEVILPRLNRPLSTQGPVVVRWDELIRYSFRVEVVDECLGTLIIQPFELAGEASALEQFVGSLVCGDEFGGIP